jgi:hypothetical protein
LTNRAHRALARAVTAAAAALTLATPGAALAQLGMGPGMGGMGGMGSPGMMSPGMGGKPAPKTQPQGPVTHAAPGADDAQKLPTTEAQLPQDPLAIPASIEGKIGTDAERDLVGGQGATTKREFYGLYYSEQSDKYRFRTILPPVWAEWKWPKDRSTVVAPLYYQRRSEKKDADIVFPFFWNLRDGATKTTIVGPFLHREAPTLPPLPRAKGSTGPEPEPRWGRHDNWFAPLYFEGKSQDGSGYFHVPPLLTFTHHTMRDGLDIVGPMFCKWKGGPACDTRTADSIDLGLAPLYFYGRDERTEYEVIPPLLHYYRYNDVGDSSTTLWGPLLWEHTREKDVFDVLPIYFHNWGKNEDHTTVLPLFHYGYKGNEKLLATPLFVWGRGEKNEQTFVTWGYARYRGRTELDMWSPLYWQYRDPDIGLDRKILFPFFYKNTSPRSSDLAVFPLYGRFHKPGISDTTFVTPLFRHTTDLTGWETDVMPVFWMGRENNSSHLVVAPFLWDFASPKAHTTVVLPFFVRHQDQSTISQLALNTYYREKKVRGGTDWELHLFPFFTYGQSPEGHWWNLFYGLAGFTREGTMSKMRLLYIPFKLSE